LILDKANKGKLWFTDLDKIDNDQLYIKDTNTIEFQNFEKLWSDLSPFMAGK
jgi:hypothetical protein